LLFDTDARFCSFNVHGIIYVPDDGEMMPIEREIRDLAAGLQAIKDEQEYLVIRERVHRNSKSSKVIAASPSKADLNAC
jgi:hypothetical protein